MRTLLLIAPIVIALTCSESARAQLSDLSVSQPLAANDLQTESILRQYPVKDAETAARAGQFGLFIGGGWNSRRPPGVICNTPYGEAPSSREYVGFGDVVTPEIAKMQAYAAAYNRALVDQEIYPYRDLCRKTTAEDNEPHNISSSVGFPARQVNGPPHDLWESARRGTISDVSQQLVSHSIEDTDTFGMTPLAWATARNNAPVVDYLLSKGASPWATRGSQDKSAVFWAAAVGRTTLFMRLVARAPRPFSKWPLSFLRVAAAGGSEEIVSRIMHEPHDPYMFVQDFAPTQTLAIILANSPQSLANEVLISAVGSSMSNHIDLVRLALSEGADPNATSPRGTALGLSANGIGRTSALAVRTLIDAGADVNLMSYDRRPVWHAANTMMLGKNWSVVDDRAKAIFLMLVRAGADLTLPNADGKPPIWSMLFPLKYAPQELDPAFLSEDLLKLFVQNGMDINARWQGQLVLTAVEQQTGHESELAKMLRSCGAHD